MKRSLLRHAIIGLGLSATLLSFAQTPTPGPSGSPSPSPTPDPTATPTPSPTKACEMAYTLSKPGMSSTDVLYSQCFGSYSQDTCWCDVQNPGQNPPDINLFVSCNARNFKRVNPDPAEGWTSSHIDACRLVTMP